MDFQTKLCFATKSSQPASWFIQFINSVGFNKHKFRLSDYSIVSGPRYRNSDSLKLTQFPSDKIVNSKMGSRFKLALIQLSVGSNKSDNLVRAANKISEAVSKGANIVSLPGKATSLFVSS